MKKHFVSYWLCFGISLGVSGVWAQLPPVFSASDTLRARPSEMVKTYLSPVRLVWLSDTTGKTIRQPQHLLNTHSGQVAVKEKSITTLMSTQQEKPGLLLDFGREIHGGIRITMGIRKGKTPARLRIRFGESVAETMSDIGGKTNATNDHALRDFTQEIPWLGSVEVGETGFRFVRIDVVDTSQIIPLKEISAAFVYRDLPYLGSFRCNDQRLNDIWLTGAYTVHLNMQNFLWDGIKRDRLVWVGDMHPEVMTINTVFGQHDIVPRSLDLARDQHPLPEWMNGISSYSMWWLLIHKNWYDFYGDLPYLRQQETYMIALLDQLATFIGDKNQETLNGHRFLDWPTSEQEEAKHAGLQAMMVMTFEAGSSLMQTLGKTSKATEYEAIAKRLRSYAPAGNTSKQAAAMMVLAGLQDAKAVTDTVLTKDGVERMSTFYGYYMLEAMAKAGEYTTALETIRQYWGGMLDLGATTFWEDFDITDSRNSHRIDELPQPDKADIHGDFGEYCYVGYRHSFCHGWASGPTPWLSRHILGIEILDGGNAVRIRPNLGDLQWAEGTFPTRFGKLYVRHEKKKDGTLKTQLEIPVGLQVKK